MLRAVCWYYGRTDCFLFLQPGEFSYGLNREGNKRFIKDSAGLAEFIEENRRKRRVVLLLRTKIFNKDCQGIPEPDFTDTSGEFTIAVYTKTSEGTLN
jgi:hypothetical protein